MVKSNPPRDSVLQYCLCAESGRLPMLVRWKVAMLRTFTGGFFRKFIRVVFYFSWLCPIYLILFCTVARKFLSMIVCDVETKVLDTEKFQEHTIADRNSDITFISLFSQKRPLRWKEINTHTHSHAYTHTHTHTHTRSAKFPISMLS